ncbi:MAG: fumarate hydratase [Chloroflexi bacterium HGW-Chloroflexi-4]|jgi:fumarate hydratase class I|nr:MAG: fumarate hydratase [Chloroflexi bacterium HGW-Chloroflexi-4]
MRDFTQELLELIRLTSTDLPNQVEERLKTALASEELGSAAHAALETILKNVTMTRKNSTPICQDTGTPIFFVSAPTSIDKDELTVQIRGAIELATQKSYLRPNAVHSITGKNSGNNLGDAYFPTIHFQPSANDELSVDLILKGGGCENVGAQYSLPNDELKAGRDLEGVRRAALDAVYRAQGEGCAPGFLGIAIGGDRGTGYAASKEVLMRDPDDHNRDAELDQLENRITTEANELGIGPMGFGGKATVLGTKIISSYRLPASFFVTISYMCWAFRHHKMIVKGEAIDYE